MAKLYTLQTEDWSCLSIGSAVSATSP